MSSVVAHMRILALLRRRHAEGATVAMSSLDSPATSATPDIDGAADLQSKANGNGNGNGNNGHGRWLRDRLSFVPLYDRGGPVSLSPSADGPIGTLARIELNARRGRPLDFGLEPNQLNQQDSP